MKIPIYLKIFLISILFLEFFSLTKFSNTSTTKCTSGVYAVISATEIECVGLPKE